MKYFGLAVLMLLAGFLITEMEVGRETYVPIVRLRTAEGFFITAVQHETQKRRACNEAIARFVKPIEEKCPGCFIESMGCMSELQGMERALAKGESLPVHTVTTLGIRLALVGPPNSAQKACEQLVAQLRSSGITKVACLPPVGI